MIGRVETSVPPPVQRLVVSVPPSANRFYRFDRGVTHISSEGRRYKSDVAAACVRGRVEPYVGCDVVLRITWFREARRGDLDNRLKQCLDAFQEHLYVNDNQISEIRLARREDKSNPRLEVLIARAGTPEADQILAVRLAG